LGRRGPTRFETPIDPAANTAATTPRRRTGRSSFVVVRSLRARLAVDGAREELHEGWRLALLHDDLFCDASDSVGHVN
jgi:hypothetical protein